MNTQNENNNKRFTLTNQNGSNVKGKILKHNNINIFDYPESEWFFVPFPSQKGPIYNHDNLATVNRFDFLQDKKFLRTKSIAESRWGEPGKVRDISWRLHFTLWAFEYSLRIAKQNSIFVELGTGKGYMAAAICNFFFNAKENYPPFYLFDLFEKDLNIKNQILRPAPFAYTNDYSEVKNYFSVYKNVKLIKGKLPDTLDVIQDKKIAFLHLDLNNADAERESLERLKYLFVKNAIILFDDYGGPFGLEQSQVHKAFSNQNNRPLLISPTGQALMIW